MSPRRESTRLTAKVASAKRSKQEQVRQPSAKKAKVARRGGRKGGSKGRKPQTNGSQAKKGEKEYDVESILDVRQRNGLQKFLVKWVGYSRDKATWEPKSNLTNCDKEMKKFLSTMSKEEDANQEGKRPVAGSSRKSTRV